MTSSLEETIRLLNKSRTEGFPVAIGFFDGPPESPRTFALDFIGSIDRIVDGSWVEASDGNLNLRVGLAEAISFEYVEPSDPALPFADSKLRERTQLLVEGSIGIRWLSGNFLGITFLREGAAFSSVE